MNDLGQAITGTASLRDTISGIGAIDLKAMMGPSLKDIVGQLHADLGQAVTGFDPNDGLIGQSLKEARQAAEWIDSLTSAADSVSGQIHCTDAGYQATATLCNSGVSKWIEENQRQADEINAHLKDAYGLLGMHGAEQAIAQFEEAQHAQMEMFRGSSAAIRVLESAVNNPLKDFHASLMEAWDPKNYIAAATAHLTTRGYEQIAAMVPQAYARMDPELRRGPHIGRRTNSTRRRRNARSDPRRERDLQRYAERWLADVRRVTREEIEASNIRHEQSRWMSVGYPLVLAVAALLAAPFVEQAYRAMGVLPSEHNEQVAPPMTAEPSHRSIVINRIDDSVSVAPLAQPKEIDSATANRPKPSGPSTKKRTLH